jgi:hypothetical protein
MNKSAIISPKLYPKTLHSGKNQLMIGKNNLNILEEGLCCSFIIPWFMGAAWIILGQIKRYVQF